MFQGLLNEVSTSFKLSFKGLSIRFQGDHKMFQGSFKKIFRVFKRSLMLHGTHRSYPSRRRAYSPLHEIYCRHLLISPPLRFVPPPTPPLLGLFKQSLRVIKAKGEWVSERLTNTVGSSDVHAYKNWASYSSFFTAAARWAEVVIMSKNSIFIYLFICVCVCMC